MASLKYNPLNARHVPPRTPDALWNWIYAYTGVRLARKGVCECHQSPFESLACMHFTRPTQMLILGARGSGKSFLTAIDTHLCSRFEAKHKTRILGGAKSQAKQVQQGIKEAILDGEGPLGWTDADQISHAGVEQVKYTNGSEVEILTASETSVRGPHVPTLRMDEVDEIDPDLRQAAMGMVMEKENLGRNRKPSMVSMTSTWHNLGGPMEELVSRANKANADTPGSFPFFKFCLFDVLRKCPDEISGPDLEYCPSCPLMKYCHEDKDRFGGIPKAKRASGHYSVRDAIQKMQTVSERIFEADYLCRGVRADGLWFTEFGDKNISPLAEYNPALPVHVALDPGLRTAAVFFQVEKKWVNGEQDWVVTIFAFYFAEGKTIEEHSQAITDVARERCNGRIDLILMDPFSADTRDASGVISKGEYEKFMPGHKIACWPRRNVGDGLNLIEGLIKSADGKNRLLIHPRCDGWGSPIQSFRSYSRKKLNGFYLDVPKDPQHPAENPMDAIRGGLIYHFPAGRIVEPSFRRVHASQLF